MTIDNTVTELLVSASDDGMLYVWNVTGSTPTKPIATMVGHQKPVNHVAFWPDDLWIASASFDNSVKLWSGKDGKFVLTFRGHVAPVSTHFCVLCQRLEMLIRDRYINAASRQIHDC